MGHSGEMGEVGLSAGHFHVGGSLLLITLSFGSMNGLLDGYYGTRHHLWFSNIYITLFGYRLILLYTFFPGLRVVCQVIPDSY